MRLLAVLLSAAAVALAVPGGAGRLMAADRLQQGRRRLGAGPSLGVGFLGVGVVGAVLVVLVDGLRLVLMLLVLGSAAVVGLLVRSARRAAGAERRRAQVVEVCEALVGELRAGQPLVTSLEHCGQVWPELAPVVLAGRLGADVPAALRRLSELPGADGLRETAAAWQVSERSGAGLATALSQVAETARSRQATRHLVRGELASAQATARLVTVLPLASLGMSAGIGGDPWHFLLATPPGVACLGLGLTFAFAGLLWIDRIAAAVMRT